MNFILYDFIGEFLDDYDVIYLKIYYVEFVILDFKMFRKCYNIVKIYFFIRKK